MKEISKSFANNLFSFPIMFERVLSKNVKRNIRNFWFSGSVSFLLNYKKFFKFGARKFYFSKKKHFKRGVFLFFELIKSVFSERKSRFLKYKDFFRGLCFLKYKKSFLLRKYKKSLNIRARKFHISKYKEFFSGWIFIFRA